MVSKSFLIVLMVLLLASLSLASSNCTIDLTECDANLANISTLFQDLQSSYDTCGCNVDPCASEGADEYDLGLHIASVFIILVASLLGVGIPVIAAYVPLLRLHPYVIALGKCAGVGVILACALVHMLQPANESLTSPCLPEAFNTDYAAYAYLFAMLAAILMHLMDSLVLIYVTKHQKQKAAAASSTNGADQEKVMAVEDSAASHPEEHQHGHEGHSHSVLLDPTIQKTIEAYMLEFGVTVHSIFIGLAVGVAADSELRALLVALVFHQFFEGLALGARISDAKLKQHWLEAILSLVFSVSAPLGIGIGIAVTSSLNPDGETFLFVQGIFDAVCAGILLYIGFDLLMHDFHSDMVRYCKGKHEVALRSGMFVALWFGAGLMAFIGRYL